MIIQTGSVLGAAEAPSDRRVLWGEDRETVADPPGCPPQILAPHRCRWMAKPQGPSCPEAQRLLPTEASVPGHPQKPWPLCS